MIWTDCDEAGYYVVSNVISRPDNISYLETGGSSTDSGLFVAKCYLRHTIYV